MSRNFKYNVKTLIEGVRDRPCLWDKTLENYKDRVERRNAWEEIFNLLDDGYDNMTWEEKRTTGETVLNKWTNVRDTFVKSLKIKMGKPKKKYLLYNELKFLTKVIPEEECHLSYDYEDMSSNLKQEIEETSSRSTRKRPKVDYNEDHPKKSKNNDYHKSNDDNYESIHAYDSNSNDNVNFVSVDNDRRVMNEDEAFFASLLPTVVKYNEDDRLEFRMEVLAVMKRIRDKKKCTNDETILYN